MVMLHWLVSRPPSLIVFSPSSMLQLGRSPVFVARLVSRTLLPVSTGDAHPSEFSSSWRSLSTELFTALLLHICPIDVLRRGADIPSRRRLRSSLTDRLDVRTTHITVADRSLSTAGPTLWNSLPNDITSAPSQTVFRRKLKTYLFEGCFSYHTRTLLLRHSGCNLLEVFLT